MNAARRISCRNEKQRSAAVDEFLPASNLASGDRGVFMFFKKKEKISKLLEGHMTLGSASDAPSTRLPVM